MSFMLILGGSLTISTQQPSLMFQYFSIKRLAEYLVVSSIAPVVPMALFRMPANGKSLKMFI